MKINQPKILSQTQEFKFASLRIERDGNGLCATVIFNNYGDDGKMIGQEQAFFAGEDFNAFWADFTSGKYIYEKFAESKGLEVEVGDDVEGEFVGAHNEPEQQETENVGS